MKCSKCNNLAHHQHHVNSKDTIPLCSLCHAQIHGISPIKSELKRLVIMRDRAIQIKLSLDNQIRGFSRIEYQVPKAWKIASSFFKTIIAELEKGIETNIKSNGDQLTSWLLSIRGLSYISVSKLVSMIDISKTKSVSSIWRYTGLDSNYIKRPVGLDKQTTKRYGNPYLKKELLGVIAVNFIREKNGYKAIYDKRKEFELEKGLSKLHADRRAKDFKKLARKVLKDQPVFVNGVLSGHRLVCQTLKFSGNKKDTCLSRFRNGHGTR